MAAADQVKLRKRLETLLKAPDNQQCADCKKRGPRWASANLGIFVCIECSGIHRNLGVHISFVRSVNLDSWTNKQVEFMEEWGNGRANAYWEANVPAHVIRPKEGDAVRIVERFIRDKYEHKRYVAHSLPPPNGTVVAAPEPVKEAPRRASTTAAPAPAARPQAVAPVTPVAVARAEPSLIDFMSDSNETSSPFGFSAPGHAPAAVRPQPVVHQAAAAPQQQQLQQHFSAFGGQDDGFGAFSSAPQHAAPQPQAAAAFGFDTAFAAPAPAAHVQHQHSHHHHPHHPHHHQQAAAAPNLLDMLSAPAPQAQPQAASDFGASNGFGQPAAAPPKPQASADAILSLYSAGMNRGPPQQMGMGGMGMQGHGHPQHQMHAQQQQMMMGGHASFPHQQQHLSVPHYGNNMLNGGYPQQQQQHAPSMAQMQNPYLQQQGMPAPPNPFAGGMPMHQQPPQGYGQQPPAHPFPQGNPYGGWPQQR